MMARSHMPFAMVCWWLVAKAMGYPITGYGSLIAAIGGLLPDIDHPESVIGRRVRVLSLPISAVFGHRGITHSLLATTAIATALWWVSHEPFYQPYRWMIAPLCVGYLSHLLGDAMTPSGVPLLYPKKKTYSFNLFKTKSTAEFILVCAITLLMIFVGGIGAEVYGNTISVLKANLIF